MHREECKTWLRSYRRVVVLLACALVMALLQAALYPWLYRMSNDALYAEAYAALQREDHAEALRLLRQLHRRVPSYEISHFLAGWAHHCRKEYDAALQAYRLAEMYTPHYAQTYANTGYILFEQGRYEDAARCFRTHLEHAPDHAGSRAMLEECQRRHARGPEIVFFSPHSNYYFMSRGADSSSIQAFMRRGIYRCASSAVRVEWLQHGRWEQDTNGVIHISAVMLKQRSRATQRYAGVWRHRGVTFLCDAGSVDALVAERDHVAAELDHAASTGRLVFRSKEISELTYLIATGAVNIVLGELVRQQVIIVPVWLLRAVQRCMVALLFVLPLGGMMIFRRVRPQTICPACGALQSHTALRGMRTLRCHACKSRTKLHVPHFWCAWLVVSGTDVLLMFWCLWLSLTVAPVSELLWLGVVIAVTLMAYTARVRLYARWLFAHTTPIHACQAECADSAPRPA